MDSLTHLVAGALTPLAFPNTPKRAAVLGFGIAVGELPDIDVIFGGSPEALLVLHRGITHALVWQPVLVLLAVLPFYIWMHCRKAPAPPCGLSPALSQAKASSGAPGLATMYLMALFGVYTHIYLDCMTTFGTQILLPFSSARIGYPAMFIVDLLLTLPALALMVLAWRQKAVSLPCGGAAGDAPDCAVAVASPVARKLALAGLAWVLLYPLAALGINTIATTALGPVLAPRGKLLLLTEPFSPFVWKAVADNGDAYAMDTVGLFNAGKASLSSQTYAKPDRELYEALKKQAALFRHFDDFCPTMVQLERPVEAGVQARYQRPVRELAFVDMRYLMSPCSAARWVGRSDPNFVLEARVNDTGALLAYRFLQRGNDIDTAWIELQ